MPTETPLPPVTAVRRFPELSTGTPLPRVIAAVKAWMKEHDAALVGGARAHDALSPTAELVTNVTDAATVAGKPALGVAATYATEFQENFDAVPAAWLVTSGTANQTTAGTGQTGGKALRQTGPVTQVFPFALPYDPSKLHRLRTRAKNVAGAGTFTYGVQALNAAGAVLGSYAVAANAAVPGTSYVEYTGWVQGLGAVGALPASDPKTPTPLPAGTVALRPYVVLNGGAPSGVMDLDLVSYERQDEDATARVVRSLLPTAPTNPDWDPRYTGGARTVTNAIDSEAIQVDVVITGRVESIDDPTIFLDMRTGLAPTDLVFSHPALALYFDGTAVFSGEVSAASFTAATAEFASFVRIGVNDPTTGHLLIYSGQAGDDIVHLYTRDITPSVPAVSGNLDTGVYPLVVSSGESVVFTGDPTDTTTVPVEVHGTLGVTGALGAASVAATGGVSGATVSATGSVGGATLSSTGTTTVGGALDHNGSTLGFYGAALATQPTVTGSRGGNAALADLLTKLATLGLIVDGTSA